MLLAPDDGRSVPRVEVARSIGFHNTSLIQGLMWARTPGDLFLISGSVLYLLATGRARYGTRFPASDSATVAGRALPSDD